MTVIVYLFFPPGSCPSDSLPCDNGRCYTPRQACDFMDDCGDGTDEKDCGTSCSFENGYCGWKSSLADNFDWTLGVGSIKGIRPPCDHTLMNETGKCCYISDYRLFFKWNFSFISHYLSHHCKIKQVHLQLLVVLYNHDE